MGLVILATYVALTVYLACAACRSYRRWRSRRTQVSQFRTELKRVDVLVQVLQAEKPEEGRS